MSILFVMGLTKQFLIGVIAELNENPGGTGLLARVVSAAACDGSASLKLRYAAGTPKQELDLHADQVHRALGAKASSSHERVDSLIIEFVDEAGRLMHSSKFGAAPKAGARTDASGPALGPAPAGGRPPVPAGHTPIPGLRPGARPDIRHIIAVGAGKGGVGKSTIALNLAVGLARRGHAVGLLDGDIYGPSMPTMLGLERLDAVVLEGQLQPFYVHGVKCMTIGKLVDPDKPLIWRGPMAHGAFKQLAEQTHWGELDYLIIDLPPGTGDVSLTMAQLFQLSGAVVVCTPQKVAQDDAVRAARMFRQLSIEVLGVVENMSFFIGDDGKEYDLFGKGGAEAMAQRLNVPFLGAIPITTSLRVNSDTGDPTANFAGGDASGRRLAVALESMVKAVEEHVALAGMRQGTSRPTLSIS